jgi:hypothetical protein
MSGPPKEYYVDPNFPPPGGPNDAPIIIYGLAFSDLQPAIGRMNNC